MFLQQKQQRLRLPQEDVVCKRTLYKSRAIDLLIDTSHLQAKIPAKASELGREVRETEAGCSLYLPPVGIQECSFGKQHVVTT